MTAWTRQHSDARGHHLVASCALSAGAVVLKADPYAGAVLNDHAATRLCAVSFRPAETLLKCSRCGQTRYSGKTAQRSDWKAGHKQECEALIRCRPKVPPATVRLAARVFWTKQRQRQSGQSTQPSDSFDDVTALLSHWDKLDDQRKVRYAQMAVITRQYMQGSTSAAELPDEKEIAIMLARFACNNHTIMDDENNPIGLGMYPLGALLNHSNEPNVVPTFEGPRIVFRAIRAVAAGAELTVAYLDLLTPAAELRHALAYHYFFNEATAEACTPSTSFAERTEYQQIRCRTCMGPAQAYDVRLRVSTKCPLPQSSIDRRHLHAVCDAGTPYDPHNREAVPYMRILPGGGDVMVSIAGPSEATCGAAARMAFEEPVPSISGDMEDNSGKTSIRLLTDPFEQKTSKDQVPILFVDVWGLPTGQSQRQRAEGLAVRLERLAHSARDGMLYRDSVEERDIGSALGAGFMGCLVGLSVDSSSGSLVPGLPALPGELLPAGGHIWRVRNNQVFMSAAIQKSELNTAHGLANCLAPIYEMAYPKVYPNLALHYAAQAKLEACWTESRPREVLQRVNKAVKMLQVQ
ncbi:hypothetical protein WJX73_004414 [Symbiochloris irregularis]|uniref:SET domain-containing protein n=1 Tax=Symbiochloris irregularis TaxID=706552 RepID=A0AAW1P1C1_9CHLO